MNAFDTVSRDVLADFLQTAVVIDDEAYLPANETKPSAGLRTPGRAPSMAQDVVESPARPQSANSLDARVLVDSFARKGLTCAVLAPQPGEDIAMLVDPVAERCDIVVFDWQLCDDNGQRTLERIKALCERGGGERLRLMCVYTGEPNLVAISEELRKEIKLQLVNDDALLLQKDSAIVTILSKKGAKVSAEYTESSVDETELADKLLDRFSGVTKGLLSNAVLAALAGINRQAHRIVRKFETALDPAYIAHRIMSDPVDNVEDEILSLIASELGSVVYQSTASSHIDSTAIGRWMDSDAGREIKKGELPCKDGDALNVLKKMAEYGADKNSYDDPAKYTGVCNKVKKASFVRESRLTESLGSKDAPKVDRRFAMLSILETHYENYTPRLSLGTIVHDGERYLLCLMPRCDSVRVPAGGRDFLFIRLEKKPEETQLIVEDQGESVDLVVSRHPYHTVIYRFVPASDGKPVWARREANGPWEFVRKNPDNSDGHLRWVADMKPQIAQAFANEYAAQVCRVGVAKSQWLHHLGGKGE